MSKFDSYLLYIDEKAFDNAAETLFGGWDSVEEVIDEVLDIHEESPVAKPTDDANNTSLSQKPHKFHTPL